MGVGIVIVCLISLGLIYIYKSVLQAGEDMETVDSVSVEQKLKKPDGWKVGKLPKEFNAIKHHSQVKESQKFPDLSKSFSDKKVKSVAFLGNGKIQSGINILFWK